MSHIITVPGFQGSHEDHWQTWLEQQLANCHRLSGVDWQQPILATWTKSLLEHIDHLSGPIYLIAHSFGCLVSSLAIADRPDRVVGALLVAPASPERFTPLGRHIDQQESTHSITSLLPTFNLNVTGYMVASESDPWMTLSASQEWARCWGLPLINLGNAGHINHLSGYTQWPLGLKLVQSMLNKHTQANTPKRPRPSKGRGSHLAKVRYETRKLLDV